MKISRKKIIELSLFVVTTGFLSFTINKKYIDGRWQNTEANSLYKRNCSVCHSLEKGKDLTGPTLYRTVNRSNEKWVFEHLIDHKLQIANGDKRALKLFNQYRNSLHPSFSDLKEVDLKQIISYLKTVR